MSADDYMTLARFASGFHEDDELRSRFIHSLLLGDQKKEKSEVTGKNNIPKVLIQFWDDAGSVPADVQTCMDSWRALDTAGFELVRFDDRSAAAYIAEKFSERHQDAFALCCHPAMRCDYFRLCYMSSSGGFYVDADDVLVGSEWIDLFGNNRLKLQPLCYDIATANMVPANELWDSRGKHENRIYYVNNNPLIAPPDHPVLVEALERSTSALLNWRGRFDIQSMTGPGNLTAALAAHAYKLIESGRPQDFELMRNWDCVAETRWNLDYRDDKRNWRNADWD